MALLWVHDVKKIENIQFRALRYGYNDFTSSYASLRGRANRQLMHIQRLKQTTVEDGTRRYKIIILDRLMWEKFLIRWIICIIHGV